MNKQEKKLLKRIQAIHGNHDWTFDPNSWIVDIEDVKAQAIAEHEADKWKKYPEKKPIDGKTVLVQISDGHIFTGFKTVSGWCHTDPRQFPLFHVIAFRELPAPYQEGGEG